MPAVTASPTRGLRLLNRLSLRLSLLAAVLAMGALALLVAVEAGRIYRELAYAQMREALTDQLRFTARNLQAGFETRARELAMPLRRDPVFIAAVRARRGDTIERLLAGYWRHFAATSSEARPEKIYLHDAQQNLIAASPEAGARDAARSCRDLPPLAAQRKPLTPGKPLSGFCVSEHQPYYAVVLPLGAEADGGSLRLVMGVARNLAAAEASLGMPLQLVFGDGTVLYRSGRGPASPPAADTLVMNYPLAAYTDGNAPLNLSLSRDMRAFNARLTETQRLVVSVATIAVLIVVTLVFLLLQKTVTGPLRALLGWFHMLREDRYRPGQPLQLGGNAEVVDLGAGVNEMTARLHALEERLENLSFTDPVTHLPNRMRFQQRLQLAFARARHDRRPFALFVMDLDHFKEINDTLGHPVGDQLLTQVAQRLRARLREADLVARLGGDEFAVLLPDLDEREAATAARLLLQALHAPFPVEGHDLTVGASIGIALCPDHGVDAHMLLQHADTAMYAAKRVNDGYAFYDSELDPHSSSRFLLMGELRQALERREFTLYFQPKVGLAAGVVTGVEVLVRWKHPRDGLVLPEVFIPLMEQTGMLRALTPWLLDETLAQCRRLADQDLAVPLSLNLSARDLLNPHLVESFAEGLAAHGVDPSRLEIEITESAPLSVRDRARESLARLAKMGLRILIDDFGVGYSSLAYLRCLPVNAIKIDRSFVIGMARSENDTAIVRTSVDLAHNLGLEAVAEGVETEETLHRLQQLGCDAAQGHYISRPLTADELHQWLRQSSWSLQRRPPALRQRHARH